MRLLSRAGISHSEDCSGAAVGRRYARADEIGVPFAVTVDYTTLEDGTVTLRERDSMEQVRVKVGILPPPFILCFLVLCYITSQN